MVLSALGNTLLFYLYTDLSVFHTRICELHQSAVHSRFQIINKEVRHRLFLAVIHMVARRLPTTSLHCSLFPVILLLQQLESHVETTKPM